MDFCLLSNRINPNLEVFGEAGINLPDNYKQKIDKFFKIYILNHINQINKYKKEDPNLDHTFACKNTITTILVYSCLVEGSLDNNILEYAKKFMNDNKVVLEGVKNNLKNFNKDAFHTSLFNFSDGDFDVDSDQFLISIKDSVMYRLEIAVSEVLQHLEA